LLPVEREILGAQRSREEAGDEDWRQTVALEVSRRRQGIPLSEHQVGRRLKIVAKWSLITLRY
jgi:hypothetical protein